MSFEQQLWIEIVKGVVTVISVGLVGGTVTGVWARYQKQRETDSQELAKLYDLYGKYLSLRRMWNSFKKERSIAAPPDASQWNFLKAATETEGAFESLLVKVASERRLTSQDEATMGAFRQACQALREAIREDTPLEWNRSEDPQYVAFKEGATYLASLLGSPRWLLNRQRAAQSLLEITSNKYES